MKQTLALLVLLLAFVSCEKPITSDDSNGSKGVDSNDNLVVSVPKDGLLSSRLNFAVYQQDGTRVKQVNQKSNDTDFGTASFQLDKGDYFLVVVAHSSDGNPTMANPKKIQFTNSQGFTETFLFCGNVTVGDEREEMSIALKRIVSLCRFVLEDDYPADVAKMRFYYTGGSGAFDATTGFGCVNSRQSLTFDVSDGRKQFDLYTFLHDIEGTIHLTVTAFSANDNVLFEREFDVPLVQNKMTWLTGSFFLGSITISTVSIHMDWGGEYRLNF